jgi:hypothetical protein
MEILTMGRLFIQFHLNSWNDLLDHLCALFIRSTRIRVPMDTKNRHLRVFSQSQELILEIRLANNMSAALDCQPICVFDNSLMLSQYLRGHSEPGSTNNDSREGNMNKVSSGFLEPSADVIPDCLRSCASVIFSW